MLCNNLHILKFKDENEGINMLIRSKDVTRNSLLGGNAKY